MTATADDAEAQRSLAAEAGHRRPGRSCRRSATTTTATRTCATPRAAAGTELVDEDYDDVVDVVLLWWRDDDGDLVDALVDAIAILADQGVVWLLTPKPGRDGHVEASDISDAAPTAGLQATSTVSASPRVAGHPPRRPQGPAADPRSVRVGRPSRLTRSRAPAGSG